MKLKFKPLALPGRAMQLPTRFPYALSLFLICYRLIYEPLVLFVISREEVILYGVFNYYGALPKPDSCSRFLFEFDFNY